MLTGSLLAIRFVLGFVVRSNLLWNCLNSNDAWCDSRLENQSACDCVTRDLLNSPSAFVASRKRRAPKA